MTEAAFIRAICLEPCNLTVRLVFADYLEEHGQVERAAFIRLSIEQAEIEADYWSIAAIEWAREVAFGAEHRCFTEPKGVTA